MVLFGCMAGYKSDQVLDFILPFAKFYAYKCKISSMYINVKWEMTCNVWELDDFDKLGTSW